METSWKLTIEALGAAAGELAGSASGEARVGLMLQALGRELRELAALPNDNNPRSTARTLLLTAERSAKVAEAATGLYETGTESFRAAAASAIQLAQALTIGAQARATPLLAQLDDQELRENFARELAAHARQTMSLADQLRLAA